MLPQSTSYDDFVESVRRFQRTSLTIACTRVGWAAWLHGEKSGLKFQDVHVCRAYIGTVAALATATGNEYRSRLASERDAIQLCHEFLGIEQRFVDAASTASSQLAELLRASSIFSNYPITVEAVKEATLHLALGPLMRSQWSGRIAAYQGVPRAWELLRRMYKRGGAELLRRHTAALNIEPQTYVQAGFGLFALLQFQNLPGFHDVADTTFEGGIERAMNVDVPSLILVASRMSRSRDELRSEYVGDMLRHTCGRDAVTSVDELPITGKRADYVVCDGNRALVIEVKRSVWGSDQRSIGRPQDVVEMWERLHEPCEQCGATIEALKRLPQFQHVTTFVPVACIDDSLLFHGRAFTSISRNLGVFDRLGLPGIEILSVLELEKGLVSIGPSKLIDLILEKQNSSSRDGMLGQYAAEHSPPVTSEHSDWTFLDAAEQDLTPPDPATLAGQADS